MEVKLIVAVVMVTIIYQVLAFNSEDHVLIDCIASISRQYLDPTHILTFSKSIDHQITVWHNLSYVSFMLEKAIYSNTILEDLILEMLHNITQWSIVISPVHFIFEKKEFYDDQDDPKHGSYIFASSCRDGDNMSDVEDIRSQIRVMLGLYSWNKGARYLVILSCSRNSIMETHFAVETLFHTMRDFSVFNVIILVKQSSLQKVGVYSWYPYKLPSGKCRELKGVELVDTFENGQFIHGVDLFPDKFPKDFHGCPLTIAAKCFPPYVFEDDSDDVIGIGGLEPTIVSYIANYLNASIIILKFPRNISFFGVGSYIDVKHSDIVIGNLKYDQYYMTYHRYLFPHFIDKYTWFVPRAEQFPRWLCIIRVFEINTWIILFLVVVLAAFVNYFLIWFQPKITETRKKSTSFCLILCNTWSVLLGISLPKLPGRISVRVYFIIFVLFSFYVSVIVQTIMMTFILDPGYLHQMDSVEELLDSDLHIFMSLFFFISHFYVWFERGSVTFKSDEEELIEISLERSNSAIFTTRYILSYFTDIAALSNKYSEFSEYSSHLCSAFLVGRGWPLVDLVNSIIMRLVEAGLTGKIMKDVINTRELGRHQIGNENVIPLAITHLQVTFIFLFIGFFLGLIVFLLELSLGKIRDFSAIYRCIFHKY